MLRKWNVFRSIRYKLIALCAVMLLAPSLVIGIISYQQSKDGLDRSGQVQLKNDVRFVIAMIETLNKQVKSGALPLEEAQETIKQQILGPKSADGTRPINKRFDLGVNGYMFIYDQKGTAIGHPSLEGKNLWDTPSPDGSIPAQGMIKQALGGGGYTTFEWALPNNANDTAPKISYSELDPNWGWVVVAGTYMSDFNKDADSIYSTLILTLLVALALGGIVIVIFSRTITKPIEQIAGSVAQIARGDLTQTLAVGSQDEVGRLAESVNGMQEQFKRLIGGILHTSQSVAAASQQISASTEEIASGSTNQAHASQTITELFKQLSAAIDNVARSAEEAAELSNETAKTARVGGETVSQSIEGMNRVNEQMSLLEQDSNRIGDIIEVIDDIAEQTNLLALNAAIEAARAGEQGRGFAVVADEVRKLAERSGEATKQITVIIKGMQNNTQKSVQSVADGVEKSKLTGKAFENIIAMVNESAQKVSEIAAASEQQTAQASEVMRSVESIAATSEEAAAASQETAATSQALAQSAEELNESVSVFKIR